MKERRCSRRKTLPSAPPHVAIGSDSFLEYAFLRWVLAPATDAGIAPLVTAQREVEVADRTYRLDYEIAGSKLLIAVELDGFEFHSSRPAFTYDRLRQNDIQGTGRGIVRFSYDAIRRDTGRCVSQLQAVLRQDPELKQHLIDNPIVEVPEMDPDPMFALSSSPVSPTPRGTENYFDEVREKINMDTLRDCQSQAFAALSNYYLSGGNTAACVMSVGAGKTALGVAASLAFTHRRALVITPGSVIRGTFDRAFDGEAVGNVLYGLPGGPLIPGMTSPKVRTLDRSDEPIKHISRDDLLSSDILVTNFHSLGDGESDGDLISKLGPDEIDFIVVDEAHIAASDSYQRVFAHFSNARTLLMSACFQRLDGRPIDADVVYRYRLIDSIADGNAKNLRVQRFSPDASQTTYEVIWHNGERTEIVGRDALLDVIGDERKLAHVTAKSTEPMRQMMRTVRAALDRQAEILHPVKPRALFSAIGQKHAEQIAQIANEEGIPTADLHYSMPDNQLKKTRERFEQDSGDLQALVQLKMLGQGYDFPPISVVVPMRPYGSFGEFYQFVGRGIRVINHPSFAGRVAPGEQWLDVVYHGELGLDVHIDTIYEENDMDPVTEEIAAEVQEELLEDIASGENGNGSAERGPDAFVLFEVGSIEHRIVHDETRVEQRRFERERDALAQRYAEYAKSEAKPVSFEQYENIMRQLSE